MTRSGRHTADPPLRLDDVGKILAGRPVLSSISLECPRGTITALLGPNGAGKTTTVSIASGLRRPSSGAANVFGHPAHSAAARASFAAVPQDISLPGAFRVTELLSFVAQQRPASSLAPTMDDICRDLGLTGIMSRAAGALSGGQRRRLFLAMGLTRAPGLLILDEATTSLDEESRGNAWSLVRGYAERGGAVLATSHIMADIEANADFVVAIVNGRVAHEGSVGQIRQLLGGSLVAVRLPAGPLGAIDAAVLGAGLAESSDIDAGGARITWRTTQPMRLVAALADLAPDAVDLCVAPMPLGELLSRDSRASKPGGCV